MILLDSIYWEMFHFSSVAQPGLQSKLEIPAPDLYFDLFSHKHCFAQRRKLHEFVDQALGESLREQLEAQCEGDLVCPTPEIGGPETLMTRLWRIKWRESVELFYSAALTKAEGTRLLIQTTKIAKQAKRKQAKNATSGEMLARGNKELEEPICFDLLQRWRDSCRDWPCVIFAYAIPSLKALGRLKSLAPIVEVGAGTGYWAYALKQLAPDVEFACYDSIPPTPEKTDNEFHGNRAPFVPVAPGDAFKLMADPSNEGRTLFLCYPPPNDGMALQCLQHFLGNTFVAVGCSQRMYVFILTPSQGCLRW